MRGNGLGVSLARMAWVIPVSADEPRSKLDQRAGCLFNTFPSLKNPTSLKAPQCHTNATYGEVFLVTVSGPAKLENPILQFCIRLSRSCKVLLKYLCSWKWIKHLFSKRPESKYFGFAGLQVSVVTIQLCQSGMKLLQMIWISCLLTKLY